MRYRFFFLAVATVSIAAVNSERCSCDSYFTSLVERYNSKQKLSNGDPLLSREVEGDFRLCKNVVADREKLDRKIVKSGRIIKLSDRISDLSNSRRQVTDPEMRVRELTQLPFEAVTKKLIQRKGLKADDVANTPINGQYGLAAKRKCEAVQPRPKCDPKAKYRTLDGTCNNLENPVWGSNQVCLERHLPANYVGESGFRQSVKGGPLPEPRDISVKVHANLDVPNLLQSQLGNFFGQLLDHDLTQAPSSITADNNAIQCCGKGPTHPQCAPISVRASDPFYSRFGLRCINFVRSALCPTCTLGPRQQVNQITSFIDASFMYSVPGYLKPLRVFDGTGRLRVESSKFGDMMAKSVDPINDKCSYPETNDFCFLAGDQRANQHRTLVSLHTVFMREHNRLATELKKLNPKWGGETLFEETRRIIGAMMQVLTYNEFLPIIISEENQDRFRLRLSSEPTKYDPEVNPTIRSEFTTASFRISHSLINSFIVNRTTVRGRTSPELLRDEYFQPFSLRCGAMDSVLRSTADIPTQRGDRHVVEDVSNFLYRSRGEPYGIDLASVNIQRGRDHGLPTYAQMVNFCSNETIDLQNFEDLISYNFTDKETKDLLQQNYKSVRDIDLWTGLVCETSLFTGNCVTGMQFRDLKFGDRFYFEHNRQAGSFSRKQVEALKKVTLTSLICLNTQIPEMPKYSMKPTNATSNPIVKCKDMKPLDLTSWKE